MALVLFFIVLATMLAVLIMSNAAQLARTTRHEHEEIIIRQMIESGRDWIAVHKTSTEFAAVTLPADSIVPESVRGEIQISRDAGHPESVKISASLRFSTHEVRRVARFRIST